MIKTIISVFALFAVTVAAQEHHTVNLVNRCGQGQAVFEVAGGQQFTGATNTVNGPIRGGLAWIKGAFGCGNADGLNCGDVEFTLINPGTDNGNTQNAINYSLQQNAGQTHTFKYKMAFTANGCNLSPNNPGPCTGPTQNVCPGAFVGTDPADGIVYQCTASNVGLTITFC
ncbi:hypothetical protein D9757_010917 [Collybiopsis confluens]|uniref:Uncharacterized protein n=1 Tax=Collybiopsis confluens TaxID=2823264 RepID=A0A8H5FR13_9AGAR|nr:hypothetical protein D9757_014711 [Collybiopsis confluens]KAF5365545.1 hypothetical protein D9757_010917 [Collybiopsis confluens]